MNMRVIIFQCPRFLFWAYSRMLTANGTWEVGRGMIGTTALNRRKIRENKLQMQSISKILLDNFNGRFFLVSDFVL